MRASAVDTSSTRHGSRGESGTATTVSPGLDRGQAGGRLGDPHVGGTSCGSACRCPGPPFTVTSGPGGPPRQWSPRAVIELQRSRDLVDHALPQVLGDRDVGQLILRAGHLRGSTPAALALEDLAVQEQLPTPDAPRLAPLEGALEALG